MMTVSNRRPSSVRSASKRKCMSSSDGLGGMRPVVMIDRLGTAVGLTISAREA